MSKINLSNFSYTQRLSQSTAQGKYPYSFVDNSSKNLVVTIGDSWTWGADITPTDDETTRLNKSFGGIISEELSADFLNLGQCGSCNLHIIERIKELDSLELEYDNVYVICTFTEVARSLNSEYDRHIDYINWFSTNPISEFLEYHNSIGVEYIDMLSQRYNVISGCNFVDPIGIKTVLPKTWVEVYNEQTVQLEYIRPCYIMSPWVIDKIRPFVEEFYPGVNQRQLVEWLNELIDQAAKRKELVSDKNFYAGINHPLEAGHKIWANYILENLNV